MTTAVRRHGALLCLEDGLDATELVAVRTLTRRGARQAFFDLERRMMQREGVPAAASPHAMLVATRLERGRVVERVRIPIDPGDDPDAGMREPRRPRPDGPRSASAACS